MKQKEYIEALNRNTAHALSIARQIPDYHKKSFHGGWSIIQILEHIYMVDRVCHLMVQKPSDRHSERTEHYGDQKLSDILVTKRDAKVNAPELLQPKGAILNPEAFEQSFLDQRNLLKQDIKQDKILMDQRIHKHPFLGEMTITDWLYFIIHHTERHLQQIIDIEQES
jgi:hypothetical protein